MQGIKITVDEVNQMQKLEQLFHNRYLTPDFLHQLIQIYVKAIQSFNKEYSFMKGYFMQKMQFVLSSPEIMVLLQGGGSAADQIRQTIRLNQKTMGSDIFEQEQQIVQKKVESPDKSKAKHQQDRFQNYKQESHHHHTQEIHHHHHHQQKNNALKLDMKMKLMREVEQNTKNLKKQINEANKKIEQNQQKVKNITKNQEQLLNQRLAKRKKKLRKKSLQIKSKKVDAQGQPTEAEPPPINKQQLKDAQRQLTAALFKFTIRLTQKQAQKQVEQRKNIKGRIKKAKDNEEDDILQQIKQTDETEIKPQMQISMKKKKQPAPEAQTRIKTIRRKLDDDDD